MLRKDRLNLRAEKNSWGLRKLKKLACLRGKFARTYQLFGWYCRHSCNRLCIASSIVFNNKLGKKSWSCYVIIIFWIIRLLPKLCVNNIPPIKLTFHNVRPGWTVRLFSKQWYAALHWSSITLLSSCASLNFNALKINN